MKRVALEIMLALIAFAAILTQVPTAAAGDRPIPFRLDFQPGELPGRSGRVGRPLRAIPTMEYPNFREIWDRHPYPGNKIVLTVPF